MVQPASHSIEYEALALPDYFRERLSLREVPDLTESLEPLYLVVFAHYPTQNRYALLLEMLQASGQRNSLERFRLKRNRGTALSRCFTHYPTQNRYALLLEMLQ
ncbi:hypothetical protein F9K79_16835 [Ochrobactrum sp. Kaboul]|nr:hypothetical protein F9K79_16835 [Ochrobactrum sp. Kaboul]